MTAPIYRTPPEGRVDLLAPFLGERVEVWYGRYNEPRRIRGRAAAHATTSSSTTADVLVLTELLTDEGQPATIDGRRSFAITGGDLVGIMRDRAFNGIERLTFAGRVVDHPGIAAGYGAQEVTAR